MSSNSKIEWTDYTWNPVTGCSKVSQGCKNCYALREWPRLSAPRPKPNIYTGREFTDVQCHPQRLDEMARKTKPMMVFVNSMSDLFHESVPFDFIDRVFSVMARRRNCIFQVLTKRPERMREYMRLEHPREVRQDFAGVDWPLSNVWLGASVEDQETANERIPVLLETPAAVRFVSAEPLLAPVVLYRHWLIGQFEHCPEHEHGGCVGCPGYGGECEAARSPGLDWVIVGGESGPKSRPFAMEWAHDLIVDCDRAGVPIFVKQLGAFATLNGLKVGHIDRKGGDWNEWPHALRDRQYPPQVEALREAQS